MPKCRFCGESFKVKPLNRFNKYFKERICPKCYESKNAILSNL